MMLDKEKTAETEKKIIQTFSDNLNGFLIKYGMNQTTLASSLGVSRSQVSIWCGGGNIPRSIHLAALCELFNCNLSTLFEEGGATSGLQSPSEMEEEFLKTFRECSFSARLRIFQYAIVEREKERKEES